jgi:hypothetical protein
MKSSQFSFRSYLLGPVVLGILSFYLGSLAVFARDTELYSYPPNYSSVSQIVQCNESAKRFLEGLEPWKKTSLWVRISICDHAIRSLTDTKRNPNPDYRYPAEGHDLESVAGRTAQIFETLLGIKLPFVTPRTSETELLRLQQEATHALEVYRAAVRATLDSLPVDAEQAKSTEKKLGEIVKQIQFAAPPSFETGVRNQRAMAQVLAIWNPIGLTEADLTKRFGAAPKQGEGVLSYNIGHTGRYESSYVFLLDKSKRIRAVFEYQPHY